MPPFHIFLLFQLNKLSAKMTITTVIAKNILFCLSIAFQELRLDKRVIGPLQQCLTLTGTASQIAGPAVFFNLDFVAFE